MNKEPERKQHKKTSINFLCRNRLVRYTISLVCKACCDSLPCIRNEARLRGIKKGMVNVDNYADGVASIHLTVIVEKH